jgi:hypothetical protein
MTAHDPLPAHLEQIGRQLTAAAESLYAPDSGSSRRQARPRRALAAVARAPRLALASAGAGLAAAIFAIAVFGTAGTPPAYALTQNSNGTYTITMNDIATGVPALNARLKQLGINTTAVPVTATCTAPNDGVALVSGWSSATLGQTITLDEANIPAGSHGVVAAYQSPSGQIDLTIATTAGSIPSCLNPNDTGDLIIPNSSSAMRSDQH